MSDSEGICDVCARHGRIRIGASRVGPVSMAYCPACIENNAESVEIICVNIFVSGGLESFDAENLEGVTTFSDGAYQPLAFAMGQYPKLEDGIREAFFCVVT